MRRFPRVLAVIPILALCLASCSAGPTSARSGPGDGVWRSDGYGWIFAVSGGQAHTYETTSMSCLASRTLDQMGQPAADGTVTFGRKSNAVETLRRGSNGQASLRLLGTAADIDLQPLAGLPAPCSRATPNDPLTNFDIYWTTYADNYNSFLRKNVNWRAARDKYRPMVNAGTSPQQLYDILTDMTRPLGDAHTSLEGPDDMSFSGLRPGTRDEDTVSRKDATTAVDTHLRDDLGISDIQSYANGKIAYADLPDGRGYLRITAFDHYVDTDNAPLRNQAELATVLDQIFTAQRVRSWRGLVVDVAFNTGGDDELGLQVAGRLTDNAYTAYRKQARNDPADPSKHGRLRTVTVMPAAGPRYTGPVTVLTSDLTVSAGETFTEALLTRAPAPVRVGTNTQGVFADDMQRTLPNGWTFGLGNEDYFGPDGHNYEGEGIPPTIQIPMFTPDELDQHRDPALDAALKAP